MDSEEESVERPPDGVDDPALSSAISDDELTALALAADPGAPINLDAVPWRGGPDRTESPLPEWYMPSAMAVGRGRATKIVIISIVVGILVINAFGLCITSGFISLA